MVHSEMEKILASLEKAATSDALEAGIVRLRDHFRIDHMAYLWIGLGAELLGASTYSAEWVARYSARNYLRIDPVVLGCYQRFDPVEWQRLDWSGRAVRAFRADARAHGVGGQGLSVPIRGPHGQFALFSANHECDDATWAEFTTRHVRDLIVIAHCLNRKATQISPHRMPPAAPPLSPREVDAISLIAAGYNRAQVANTLSISEHTLRAYIESARLKLGALNTTHAVARALSRGLIVV